MNLPSVVGILQRYVQTTCPWVRVARGIPIDKKHHICRMGETWSFHDSELADVTHVHELNAKVRSACENLHRELELMRTSGNLVTVFIDERKGRSDAGWMICTIRIHYVLSMPNASRL